MKCSEFSDIRSTGELATCWTASRDGPVVDGLWGWLVRHTTVLFSSFDILHFNWPSPPSLITKHKPFGLVQLFVISTLFSDMGRRMVIDTGMVVVIFISLMFRVHQKCVSVLYLIRALMYRMSKNLKIQKLPNNTIICMLFGIWNFGMSLFILFFEKRSWLTEWIVDLDASQNNSGTQQNQEQIGKYASFPQEIQVTRYSCCHRDSVSDSDQLRITLLDFFLVLQLVVEGCRFIDTYRGGRLAMLMMTWMILATILSKTESDSYLEGAATTELVEERTLDHFGASLSSLDEVSPSV